MPRQEVPLERIWFGRGLDAADRMTVFRCRLTCPWARQNVWAITSCTQHGEKTRVGWLQGVEMREKAEREGGGGGLVS